MLQYTILTIVITFNSMKSQKYNIRHSSSETKYKQIKKQKQQKQKLFRSSIQKFGLDNSIILLQRKKSSIKLIQSSPDNSQKLNQKPISKIIQEQAVKQIQQIESHPFLKQYYYCMISIFMILYTTSQVIVSNIFQLKKKQFNIPGFGLVGVILGVINTLFNEWRQTKIKKFARAMLRLAHSPSAFEKKIEFIARKITLNVNKQRDIIGACLAYQLITFWDRLLDILPSFQIQMVDSMFQTPQQQLCYRDVCYFINNYVCNHAIFQRLSHFQREDDSVHQLAFQFSVIEIFCFEIDNEWRPEIQKQRDVQESKCLLF